MSVKLETYEWDSTWIEQTEKTDSPRILYIGDSISNVTRGTATRASGNTVLFDGLGTSKAVDNPYFCETISLFAKQQGNRRAVVFNSGLHGPHLEDREEYKFHYEKMLEFLFKEFENTPIILLLSTATANPERNVRAAARNLAVTELAEKYALPTIDFYSVSQANIELLCDDGIHFTKEGYELLGKELYTNVKELLAL